MVQTHLGARFLVVGEDGRLETLDVQVICSVSCDALLQVSTVLGSHLSDQILHL